MYSNGTGAGGLSISPYTSTQPLLFTNSASEGGAYGRSLAGQAGLAAARDGGLFVEVTGSPPRDVADVRDGGNAAQKAAAVGKTAKATAKVIMSDDEIAIKYAQDKFAQQQTLASIAMSGRGVPVNNWDGTSISATKYTLRQGMLNSMQDSLGDSQAANLAVGFTKGYLYLPETLLGTVESLMPLNQLRRGANLAVSLYNDPAGTIRGGVESLQDGFRLLNSETAAGDRAKGELVFNILAPVGAAKLGRFGAAAEGVGSLEYTSRIRARAINDPAGHNFPFSFDEAILGVESQTLRGGAQGYALRGYKNNSEVIYNIIVKDGQITHRDVININNWNQRSKSFGWPLKLEDIPTRNK